MRPRLLFAVLLAAAGCREPGVGDAGPRACGSTTRSPSPASPASASCAELTLQGVDDHHIATRFLQFVGPLLPLESIYVTSSDIHYRGSASVRTVRGVPLELHPVSIVAGYLRAWLLIAIFVYPFATHYGEPLNFGWRSPWIECAGFTAAWLLAMFAFRRPPKDAVDELRVLCLATGMAVDPKWLRPITLSEKTDVLAHRVEDEGLPLEASECIAALAELSGDLVPLYAYARYKAVKDRSTWKPVADAIWPRVAARARPATSPG